MKDQTPVLRLIHRFFPIFLIMVLFLIGIPVGTYHYFARDLDSEERIMNRNNTGLTLLDRNDEPFFIFYGSKSREEITMDQIPQHLQDAVVAIEDKNFYTHEGFSVTGIVRSLIANIQEKELVSGGSTITQQLVKNSLLHPKKSFLRKYQEIVLAQELERRYTKKDILEMYLNSIYFGEGAFGVEQAARIYFGKSASQLDLAESTLLAGVLPAPSTYSPISGNGQAAKDRQRLVLQKMVEEEYITTAQMNEAYKKKLSYSDGDSDINQLAPHFAVMVKQQLVEKYGEEQIIRSGFEVKTTLDPNWQSYAERVVKEQVELIKPLKVSNGSVVVIEPESREVRVMVGSIDWNEDTFGKFNVAVTPRQPGSSFKPLVYATAIEKEMITSATVLKDVPTTFGASYKPLNYDRKFRGNVTVRRALANSLNIPAVHIMEMLSVPTVLDAAAHFGISTLGEPVDYGPSLVLGTGEVTLLEMTNAYATFADEGTYKPPVSILQITDKYGVNIYKHTKESRKAVSPETAYIISSILSDNAARSEAFGNVLNISRPAAVKTGTTDNYKDAWTIGYTPQVTVGVWIGNNDNTPMDSVPGSIGAAPIWRSLMEYYNQGQPPEFFSVPEGVVATKVCKNGYLLPPNAPASAGYTEYFIQGTQPTTFCSLQPSPTPSDAAKLTENQQQPAPTTVEVQQPAIPVIPTIDIQIDINPGRSDKDNSNKKDDD